jgi:hypothetical protein
MVTVLCLVLFAKANDTRPFICMAGPEKRLNTALAQNEFMTK